MSMKSWAKREIDIACKKERVNDLEGGWNYGVACYNLLAASKLYMEEENER